MPPERLFPGLAGCLKSAFRCGNSYRPEAWKQGGYQDLMTGSTSSAKSLRLLSAMS